jgi:hypothetical protein
MGGILGGGHSIAVDFRRRGSQLGGHASCGGLGDEKRWRVDSAARGSAASSSSLGDDESARRELVVSERSTVVDGGLVVLAGCVAPVDDWFVGEDAY